MPAPYSHSAINLLLRNSVPEKHPEEIEMDAGGIPVSSVQSSRFHLYLAALRTNQSRRGCPAGGRGKFLLEKRFYVFSGHHRLPEDFFSSFFPST